MTNAEIAQVFARISDLLEIRGEENPFRVRAYVRATAFLENTSHSVCKTYEEGGVRALEELPGIGKDLAGKITELCETGKLTYLKEIEKKFPPGLLTIMEIEGIGPKKTKVLWQKFKVKSVVDLKKLARSGKLQKLKGWGEKTVQNILKGIDVQKQMAGRLSISEVLPLAEEIVDALKKTKLCEHVEIAGSLRRRKETIGDIDILATSRKPEAVMEVFCSLPHVARVTNTGNTKSTVFLKIGIDADLRVVEPDVFGAALQYFTGSKNHNVHVRKIGVRNGITISEYGVFEGSALRKGTLIAAHTEEEVYKTVGLSYIEPELREDCGEVEAAQQKKLPILITEDDIKGDLHCHSDFSDGTASMIEMAKAAKEAGLKYIAITDHASPMGMVKGIKENNIAQYLKNIEEARKKVAGIDILAGAEVDILADGKLYLPDDVLKKLDWVVVSIHSHFKQSRSTMTKRILRALQNPHVNLFAHPTARILGRRPEIECDMDAILKEAKKQKKYLELNASPERLDLSDVHCKRAKELGVKICINSDAHSVQGFDYRYGVFQARRGWLEKKDVVNTEGVGGGFKWHL